METKDIVAAAHLDSGEARYAQRIRMGRHTLAADEPAVVGGGDTGASPYGLVLAGLAACTAITRMRGFRCFAAMQVPQAPLPRPTGTTIVSSPGSSSSISTA